MKKIIFFLITFLMLFSTKSYSQCSVPNVNLFGTINVTSSSASPYWRAISGALSYNVQYRIRNVGASYSSSLNTTTNSITINGLQSSTNYEFIVQTVCNSGSSAFSSSGWFTTKTGTSSCSIPNTSSFGTNSITSSSASPYWASISGAISYNVQYRIRNIGASYSASINTTSNSLTINNLQSSTNYEFIVQTVCSSGSSAFSSSGWFTTSQSTSTCGVPNVNLFGTINVTSSSASPYWTAISGAISYNVQYRIRNIGASYSSSLNTAVNSITITNLQSSTNYEFIVQTVCNSGSSAFSSSGWFTTSQSTSTCGISTNLSASNITTSSANIAWTTVSGSISYNIRYRIVGASSWISTTSTVNNKSLTGLSQSSNYEFQIQTVCSAGTSVFSGSYNFTTNGTTVNNVPIFNHIVVVIGENTNASSVIGNTTDAPYINNLAQNGAYFTNSFALSHPSQPNYLQLFSGSNQGVTNDSKPSAHFTTPNLARELINAGKTFIHYSEGMPSVGYDGTSSGLYQRKHNPLANWMGTGTNQVSTTLNQPYTAFPTNFNNLPNVSFVVPDMCNDGHDVCPPYNNRTKQYDAWIQSNLDAYKQYCSNPLNNSLLIVTYDEDDFTSTNKISTVFYGDHVLTGNYNQTITHYDVLRMIEDANGLTTHTGAAANSNSITFCWSSLIRELNYNLSNNSVSIDLYPNPTNGELNIKILSDSKNIIKYQIIDQIGKLIEEKSIVAESGYNNFLLYNFNNNFKNGIYYIKTEINGIPDKIYKIVLI
jgi:acid phosphatase